MDGVIVIDKPSGWTSHDVVNKVRRIAQERSIGHLGTLDPLATGVLPLIVGRATRLARFFTGNEKRYDAEVRLGVETDSYDRDGEITATMPDFRIDRSQFEEALNTFRGVQMQTPPPVSAKKVGGVPAYKLARKKIAVELKPVEIMVFSTDLLEFDGTIARLVIHCTAGTYVRGIAHDLGRKLGCGAMLESLRRLASGGFTVEQSYTLEHLQQLASENNLQSAILPAAQLLPQFPSERVDPLTVTQIRQGRDFRLSPFRQRAESQFVKAVGDDGELVAIGEARLPHLYHPILVF